MAWHDQLRGASFRGVGFHSLSSNATFGRRTAQHDYPFRDMPFVEDLGRQAREISVTGFVLGADYMTARDALIAAVEKSGPGKLVHPYLGEMTVSVTGGLQVAESTAEGGVARITFTCVESGELKFPSAQAATQDVLASRSADARTTLADGFAARFGVDALPGWAVQGAFDRADGFLDMIEAALDIIPGATGRGDVLGLLDALRPELGALLRQPLALARRIGAITSSLRSAIPGRRAQRAFAALATFGDSESRVPATTPSRRREAANRDALIELVRGTAAIERAHAVSDVQFTDYADAVALRDGAVEQLDGVADITTDDALFNALTAVRAAVVRDVSARGANLARTVRVTPPVTLPALVLAYDLFDDAHQDAALIARNSIVHPGFVPGGVVLEVPTNG